MRTSIRTTLATTTAILVLAGAVVAQDQPAAAEAEAAMGAAAAGGPFVEPGEDAVFAAQLVGIAVYAPHEAGQVEALAAANGHQLDAGALVDFQPVGQVVDLMLSRDGEPRAVVLALGDPTEPADPAFAEDPAVTGQPPDPAVGAPGWPEVAVALEQITFYSDAAVPDVMFAVVGVTAEELQQAPLIERPVFAGMAGQVADPAQPETMPGWRMGRAPMTAPAVTVEGFTQVPIAEVSADQLIGANVIGADNQIVGSIGDVILDAEGGVEYVLVDVGGFLGIGTREVAIGFDEMTVLHDPGWTEVQVHIAATEAELEAMPEYQPDQAEQPQQPVEDAPAEAN